LVRQFWGFGSARILQLNQYFKMFVVRQIVSETIGPHRCAKALFKEQTVTVGDCLDAIDRAVGSATGWQRLQKKAGIKA
jgi:hypothetical protein